MDQATLYAQYNHGQHKNGLQLIEMLAPKSTDKIIDIGSGTGNLTHILAQKISNDSFVLAIEPDLYRSNIAKKNTPQKVNNIKWFDDCFDKFNTLNNSFDSAYSNYVFHWIKDQEVALKKVYDLLKVGGIFAFCCVYNHPEVIEDLNNSINKDRNQLKEKFHYRTRESWLALFNKVGFTIETISDVNDYYFKNLDELMIWWNATTHGVFNIEKIPKETLNNLYQKYPGPIKIYKNETLRLLAKKH